MINQWIIFNTRFLLCFGRTQGHIGRRWSEDIYPQTDATYYTTIGEVRSNATHYVYFYSGIFKKGKIQRECKKT